VTDLGKQGSAPEKSTFGLEFLECLISWWYEAALEHHREHPELKDFPKVGEFLKMLETHRKLAPDEATHKELWKLLEKIRKEGLPLDSGTSHASTEAPPKGDRPK